MIDVSWRVIPSCAPVALWSQRIAADECTLWAGSGQKSARAWRPALDGGPRRPKSGMSSRPPGARVSMIQDSEGRDERHLGLSGLGGDARRFLSRESVARSPKMLGPPSMVRSQPMGAVGNGAHRHGSALGLAQISAVGTRIAASGWRPRSLMR